MWESGQRLVVTISPNILRSVVHASGVLFISRLNGCIISPFDIHDLTRSHKRQNAVWITPFGVAMRQMGEEGKPRRLTPGTVISQ
jgi:hypothetical protein